MKLVGELDAGNRHVQFDERGRETECWPSAPNHRARPRLYPTFEVKRSQTIRHSNVDVAHGLALLFGIGARALVWGFFCLQQFSTPIGLAFVASVAAAITPSDVVLEPSVGTGLLAILAELAGASLVLNEFADSRAGILKHLFPAVSTTQFDAAHINDHLDAGIVPSAVLMNPPFSAAVHVDRKMADAALRHVASALARLGEGGRLVVITGASLAPDNLVWTESFKRLQEHGRVVFSAAIDGAVYAKHGTNIVTRLTVIDKVPAGDIASFPPSPGIAPDLPTLLGWVIQHVPPRCPVVGKVTAVVPATASPSRTVRTCLGQPQPASEPAIDLVATEVAYELVDWMPTASSNISDALYEVYAVQSIRIPGAQAHPTKLVQSAAMV